MNYFINVLFTCRTVYSALEGKHSQRHCLIPIPLHISTKALLECTQSQSTERMSQ